MGIAVTTEERVAVEQALRQPNLRPRVRERLEMVKAAALGDELARIAAWSGRSPRTVAHWLERFAAGGLPALADAPRAGRPVRADDAYRQALATAAETPPPQLGLSFDVWTSARLAAYLAERAGVRLAAGWVRVLLSRGDWACGRPKHTLKHLQDPAAVTACQAELAAVGGKGAGGAGAQ
jgi:transposase